MIQEDKTSTKKMLSTKNPHLYRAVYLISSVLNDKQEISGRRYNTAYCLSFHLVFLLLWEVVDVLINRKKNISFIVIISMVLVMYIANMLR